MSQHHGVQHGMFHVTTNARGRIPWCTVGNIPRTIIDNLVMTRNMHRAELYAFCILPDHMHIIFSPGTQGLSAFMHSWKRNTMRDVRRLFPANLACVDGRYGSSAAEMGMKLEARIDPDLIAWQKSFHDERIRDAYQCTNSMAYVRNNALNHNLVNDPLAWPWSSLRFPELTDMIEPWLD